VAPFRAFFKLTDRQISFFTVSQTFHVKSAEDASEIFRSNRFLRASGPAYLNFLISFSGPSMVPLPEFPFLPLRVASFEIEIKKLRPPFTIPESLRFPKGQDLNQ
jgi:hypothetical protein